jgi:hypothetical protein
MPTRTTISISLLAALVSMVIISSVGVRAAVAQAVDPAWVLIESNQPESHVYADSTWIGSAASGALQLPVGTLKIMIVPAAPDYWSVAPVISEIGPVSAGDSLILHMDFPFYYSIESIPSGALVEFDSGFSKESLGQTPLIYESAQPLAGDFVLSKDGYRQRRVAPGLDLWNRQLVSLQNESELYRGGSEASTEAPKARKKWIDYVAASAVIVGGALAVYYKTEANQLYDQYTETGDPVLRSEIETLDTKSALALGTMQVGFTVVVVRLAF